MCYNLYKEYIAGVKTVQLKIILSGNRIQLPIATSYTLQGFIYNALRDDSLFSYELHEKGNTFKQRKYKLFTFSELKGKYEVIQKQIIYERNVSFEIRSNEPYMIQLLYTYFTKNQNLRLGNNDVKIEEAVLEEKTIFDESISIKTLSPITVYSTDENGHTTYFSPQEECFYNAITENAKRKWVSCFGDDDGFGFSIKPTENTKFLKRATSFKKTLITAWHGEFHLEGNIKTLNFLYNTGLGSKNSQGFGMFEVL